MIVSDFSGLSVERLAAIDNWLREAYVETGRLPGTLLQVWHRGALVHNGMTGLADVEARRPMHEDAIFRIYSMTKPILTTALLSLVEEGKLALYDKVTDHIPQWRNLRVLENGALVPPRRPMTILDLARHTSGLSGHGGGEVLEMYRERDIAKFSLPGGLDGLIGLLTELPLEFHPGEKANYSIGPSVLGYVMQTVCGKPLRDVLTERVFEPLGMKDTGFFCTPENAPRLAGCYRWQQDRDGFAADFEHDFTRPPILESGDGGLVSTAADYMRLCRMLLNRGTLDGVRVLSPKSVELLRINHLPENKDIVQMSGDNRFDGWIADGMGISICCGTTIDPARRMIPCSVGDIFWGGAACTYMLVDPAEDLIVLFMTQVLDAPFFFELNRRLFTRVYGAFMA